MCDCVEDASLADRPLPAQWVNESGEVVHPDSPAGRGGAGHFRQSGPTSGSGASELLLEPGSPAIRTMDPLDIQHADVIALDNAKRQPGPVVAQDSTETKNGITINLLSDGSGAKVAGAETKLWEESTGKLDVHYDEKDICDSFTDGIVWTANIQTQYGTGNPDADAAYGRGTTADDAAKGNVTLGFHESCHRQDLLTYLRTTPVPTFKGALKSPRSVMEKAIADYKAAWKTYFDTARSKSIKDTDETGDPTLTQYKSGKRRSK